MCGIAGFWRAGGMQRDDATAAVARMSNAILHRGPDDDGVYVAPEDGVALAFRRLAIIDLTPLGHQPMASPSGRFRIVFNGEIYNHRDLRSALQSEGVVFRGRSDTESLCAGFERWGVRETLERAYGMFAIAAWDTERRVLTIARDRIGIKPLYVYKEAGFVSFASEPKAIVSGPKFQRQLDAGATDRYITTGYVTGSQSIWRGVSTVTPGSLIEISDPSAELPPSQRFWSIEAVARANRIAGVTLHPSEIGAEVERVIGEAVASHLESDVPLGAFLSGGIDSTTVVSLMQEKSSSPVRTFTIQFDDPIHDEAEQAAAIAKHLGTDHTTIALNGDDALELIPELPTYYDEPFADSSQLPTLLVSRAARKHVTVVLTGDGGDELFAGYNRYLYGTRTLNRVGSVPSFLRTALSRMIDVVPAGGFDAAFRGAGTISKSARDFRLADDKVRKFGRMLNGDDVADRYFSLVRNLYDTPNASTALPQALHTAFRTLPASTSLLDRMLLADQLGYLPDNQMTKVDRASMAVSLEARVPLLDHRVAELAWKLPTDWLVRNGVSKWALREVAYKRVPKSLLDRPKMGFSVPLGTWLRGPLRGWAEELIRPTSVNQGPLDSAIVSRVARRLWSGNDDSALTMWAILQFESWRRRWLA